MALITWNDGLSVGLPEIDRQHKNLISIINDLDEATRAGKAKDVVSKVLDDLIIYTATHFRMEEKYFAQFEYADSKAHKEEHAALIEKVNSIEADLNSASEGRRLAIAAELMSFLGIWWNYHILETDMKYAKLAHEKGLK